MSGQRRPAWPGNAMMVTGPPCHRAAARRNVARAARASVASISMIPVRDDLRALEGYHSPQVDVRVRLNTNESPAPPPAAWRDAFAAELSRVEWHRYPDRAATGTAHGDRRLARRRP